MIKGGKQMAEYLAEELSEEVQIDVKEVPFNCLKKSAKINENAFINIPLSMSVPEYALYMVLKNTLQRTLLDF